MSIRRRNKEGIAAEPPLEADEVQLAGVEGADVAAIAEAEDELRRELEDVVAKLFKDVGILDAEMMRKVKQLIDVGAPERLRPRLYELFRDKIGTVKLLEIVQYGVEGVLRNVLAGEGGTDTSMSDLA